jgi:hypothetical protein
MAFVPNYDMVQTIPADTAQNALADRSGSTGTDWSPEHLDPTACGHTSNLGSGRTVVLPDAVARPRFPQRGFLQFLCHPGIGRVAGHTTMHHASSTKLKKRERK